MPSGYLAAIEKRFLGDKKGEGTVFFTGKGAVPKYAEGTDQGLPQNKESVFFTCFKILLEQQKRTLMK